MAALHEFSVGVLHGWRGVLFGLAASSVFLFAGWQDVGPGPDLTSSAFWFFLALTLTGSFGLALGPGFGEERCSAWRFSV